MQVSRLWAPPPVWAHPGRANFWIFGRVGKVGFWPNPLSRGSGRESRVFGAPQAEKCRLWPAAGGNFFSRSGRKSRDFGIIFLEGRVGKVG